MHHDNTETTEGFTTGEAAKEHGMQWVVRCNEASADDSRLGGKARAPAALGNHGLPVPPWFVVLPEAFHSSLSSSEHEELTTADPMSMQAVIGELMPSAEVMEACNAALSYICRDDDLVAVRSSAVDEDGT